MAEKEQIIMIVADEPYCCNSCKKINNCSKDCKRYIEWFNRPDPIRHFYSRSEAIKRMAKAICSVWGIGSCKSCAFKGDGSMCQDFIDAKKELAEAALNALLEGK